MTEKTTPVSDPEIDNAALEAAEIEQARKAKLLGIAPPHILIQAGITNGMSIGEQIARVEKLGFAL